MEKTYNFKAWLDYKLEGPILTIKPFSTYKNKPIPYPITFKELNVPIKVNESSIEDSFDLEYLLDFEESYNREGEFVCKNKFKLIRVLNDFSIKVDEDIRNAINGNKKLDGKKISFTSDDGLEWNTNLSRQGNTRRARTFVVSKNNKTPYI